MGAGGGGMAAPGGPAGGGAAFGDPAPAVPPPADAPEAKPEAPPAPAKPAAQEWALQGLRSLPIDLQLTGDRVTFHSLGEEPEIGVTLANNRRLNAAGWALALAVALAGLALTRRPARTKAAFVAVV